MKMIKARNLQCMLNMDEDVMEFNSNEDTFMTPSLKSMND